MWEHEGTGSIQHTLRKRKESSNILSEIKCWNIIMGVPLHVKQAQRGGRSVTVPVLDSGARRGWVVGATPWPL